MPRKANPPKTTKNVEKKESKSEKKQSKSEKTSTKKSDKTPVANVVKKESKSSRVKSVKSVKSVKIQEEPVDTEPVESVLSDVEDSTDTPKKKRRVPTKESVVEGFDDLVSVIEQEIARLRESPGKVKGVKFLRYLGKSVKSLRGHSVRVMKQKQKTNRKNNTNSGFLKPVQISEDMAKFTGWNHDDLKSRVDVTKYICKYIRDNDLQNPEDRRQILADKKLSKLLEYSTDSDDKPLTYYRIQTYMKKHFTNPPKEEEKV
jgi:upstream activation factor subunit UAF30